MSTLQHISQQTFRIRFGRRLIVAAVAVVLAIATVTVALVASSGGASFAWPEVTPSGATQAPQTEAKYFATHAQR